MKATFKGAGCMIAIPASKSVRELPIVMGWDTDRRSFGSKFHMEVSPRRSS